MKLRMLVPLTCVACGGATTLDADEDSFGAGGAGWEPVAPRTPAVAGTAPSSGGAAPVGVATATRRSTAYPVTAQGGSSTTVARVPIPTGRGGTTTVLVSPPRRVVPAGGRAGVIVSTPMGGKAGVIISRPAGGRAGVIVSTPMGGKAGVIVSTPISVAGKAGVIVLTPPSSPPSSLLMDAVGWVSRDTNSFGIQGAWYWYSDAGNGGQTQLLNVVANAAPFVSGVGMCLVGITPGGSGDNYTTWGAGIGLNLNQAENSGATLPLPNGPPCYFITIIGSAPGGLRAKLAANPSVAAVEPPGQELGSGTNDVCIYTVRPPSWCASTTMTCQDASSLARGVAAIQVQASAGSSGGGIQFCVTSIVPHY